MQINFSYVYIILVNGNRNFSITKLLTLGEVVMDKKFSATLVEMDGETPVSVVVSVEGIESLSPWWQTATKAVLKALVVELNGARLVVCGHEGWAADWAVLSKYSRGEGLLNLIPSIDGKPRIAILGTNNVREDGLRYYLEDYITSILPETSKNHIRVTVSFEQ